MKYHFKLIALLHEIGHVDDFERQINFKIASRSVDIIAAEVYAHRFALNEANRLGLFMVATTLIDSLRHYVNGTDYRAEVAKRVVDEYQNPKVKTWGELTEGSLTHAEVALIKNSVPGRRSPEWY